jgi:hypothetical protein
MKHARVKDILISYQTGGMVQVARYLSDPEIEIEENTWEWKMKKLLDSHNWGSMEAEIASLLFTFKLTEEDGPENTIGKGNTGEGSES